VIVPRLPRTHHDLTEPDRGITSIGGQPEDPSGVMADQDQGHQPTTRETYRALLLRGFSPGEAANLTAYLAGIEVGGGRPWRLVDVDRLLFLRELCRTGRIGADDGLQPMEALVAG
jgi:hypothetical protein